MDTLSVDTRSAETTALDALDVPAMVQDLQTLVRVPSVGGSAAESDAQLLVGRWLGDAGCDVDLWTIDVPELAADPDFPGMEVPPAEALGLVGAWGQEDGPTLVLNGHVDVVPPGDLSQWSTDPFAGQLRGDVLYGRGACDMKAGLVAAVHALRAVRSSGVRLRGRVLLQSVVGEEDGGLGTVATLRRGYRGDAAVLPEPTGLDLVPACAGALTLRLTVSGLSTHAAVRGSGVSSLEKFWLVWRALLRLERRRNLNPHPLMSHPKQPYPISIGTVSAGAWASSVPDLLVAEGRLGVALDEDPDEARRQLEQTVAEVCDSDAWLRDHRVQVAWSGGSSRVGSCCRARRCCR